MTDEASRKTTEDEVTADETPENRTEEVATNGSPSDADSTDEEANHPKLSVTPTDALIDEPLAITLAGLRPGQRVTLTAEFVERGAKWRCSVAFDADAEGVVSLAERAPIGGDYTGVRPMGLVQFATRVEEAAVDPDDSDDRYDLHLFADADGTRVAETTVTRRYARGVERVELDPERTGVVGECYFPAGDGPHPGVVALHGSGGEPRVRTAKALASLGFAALALRYFGEPDPLPNRLAEIPLSYFDRAIEWLRSHDAVSADDVGIFGVSRGTEAALLTATRRDDIGAVVAYAPSAYVMGEPSGPNAEGRSAWLDDGEPLPTLPSVYWVGRRTERGIRGRPYNEACVECATDDQLAAATIPIEECDADVLLVSGGDDCVWQADEMGDVVAERIRDGDAAGSVEHRSYADAGHSIAVPYAPTTGRSVVGANPALVFGGTPEGIAEADADAWPAVLDAFEAGTETTDVTTDGGTDSTDDEQAATAVERFVDRENVEFHEAPAVVAHQHHFELYEPIDGMAIVGVTDESGRVLLRVHTNAPHAHLPHAPVEPGDDWKTVARRAVEETTGVAVEIDGVERVKRKYYSPEADDDRRSTANQVFFRASPVEDGTVPDEFADASDGEWAVGWFDDVPEDAAESGDEETVDDVRLFLD